MRGCRRRVLGSPAGGPRRPAQPPPAASRPRPGGVPAMSRRCPTLSRPCPRCSITARVTASLHRSADFFASTPWGLRSCPSLCPQAVRPQSIKAGQTPVDSWKKDLHRLWMKRRSTGPASSCPPTPHRLRPVVPRERPSFHISVHCSATRRPVSPCRVKGVTPSCRVGLCRTGEKLGTQLGTTTPLLCMGCAELLFLHR